MDVYYNENGYTWGKSPGSQKLNAIPIGKTFFWEDQEIFLPALYVGQSGAVLDVCAKISLKKMLLFLQKWHKERRLSLHTPEEFDQMEADNPSSREFFVDMELNGAPLTCRMGSSLRWYPPAAFLASSASNGSSADTSVRDSISADPSINDDVSTDASAIEEINDAEDWSNDPKAELLMTAYGCDRESCWQFVRMVYAWSQEPILSPQHISLHFKARPFPVTTTHFVTCTATHMADGHSTASCSENKHFLTFPSCEGQQIKAIHPRTGQEYILTLQSCEQTRHDFSGIDTEGMQYPEYCQILTYSVSPEIDRELLDIRDCEEGDQPRAANVPQDATADAPQDTAAIEGTSHIGDDSTTKEISNVTGTSNVKETSNTIGTSNVKKTSNAIGTSTIHESSSAMAVFMAWKDPAPDRRMAASSMHFTPVSTTHWRVVFQVKEKEDYFLSFSLKNP